MGSSVMRRKCARLAALVTVGVLATVVVACGGTDNGASGNGATGGGDSDKGPIVIGMAVAKTGLASAFDRQPALALQLRLKEINDDGGIDGRQVEAKWIDTKSDKTLAASVATQLIQDGAVVIVTTCDFDYGSPATFQARSANVPSISLCASSPKAATPSIVGEMGFSMSPGSDTEGVNAAEWIMKAHPNWKRAYILRDTSLEYSRATADYFKARWKELGGKIAGEDNFVGGENADISAQATRAAAAADRADVIYLGSYTPSAGIALRQLRQHGIDLPIVGNQSGDGLLMKEVAGNITGYYSLPLACIPSYCDSGEGPNQDAVNDFSEAFEAAYGEPLNASYPINGYDLGTVLKQAIQKAGSTEGAAIAETMETMGDVHGITSTFRFSKECHRPIGYSAIVLQWNGGENEAVATVKPKSIPDIGDSNPCAGPQDSGD